MKTHLYLDVDGVLNAYMRIGGSKTEPLWDGGYKSLRAQGFEIVHAPAMIDRLNELIDRHDIVVHWLTTWEYDARPLGERLGLTSSEEWEVLRAMQYSGKGGWLKLNSIKEHVEETNPDVVIWIDDDLRWETAAMDWINENAVIWFAPDGVHGIVPEMLEEINDLLSIAAVGERLYEALTEIELKKAASEAS